jgi:3-polyprenyl-4-hydroxybenzoate decarboxylase
MAYFKDVREHLAALETAGLLVRVDRRINKDTELNPLVRLQFRGLPEILDSLAGGPPSAGSTRSAQA